MAVDTKKWDTAYEGKAVTLLGLGFGLVGLDRWIIAPLLPSMIPDLGLNVQQAGNLIGALGLVWGVSAFIMWPAFFWWLSPVLAGLVLSIPVSILLSKATLGRGARTLGIFLTPEETHPPYELRRLAQNLAECYRHLPPLKSLRADYGLMQAVLDPYVNALHVALLRQRQPLRHQHGDQLGAAHQRLGQGLAADFVGIGVGST